MKNDNQTYLMKNLFQPKPLAGFVLSSGLLLLLVNWMVGAPDIEAPVERSVAEAIAMPESEVRIQVNWPSWAEENQVELYNAADQLLFTVCVPTNCFNSDNSNGSYTETISAGCYPDGPGYYLIFRDAFGDGWNGNGSAGAFDANGNALSGPFTFANGSSGQAPDFMVSGGGAACAPAVDPNDICVSVFNDYNSNGTKDGVGELGIEGITVTAYDASNNASPFTYTSDGNYEFTPGNADTYRVEVTGIPADMEPTVAGATTVFFIDRGNKVEVGLHRPAEHFPSSDVYLAIPCYVEGGTTGANASGEVMVVVPENSLTGGAGNLTPTSYYVATQSQIGSTFGTSFSRSASSIFAAAFMKRHTAFGPVGTGGIYKIDLTIDPQATTEVVATNVSPFLDLNTLFGANTAGVNPHPNGTNFDVDPNAYDAVGKVGLGGLALSDTDNVLWTVNLADRRLYEIPLGGTFQNPTPPASSAAINVWPTSGDLTGLPGLTGNPADIRPFAVKYYRGEVYLGLVNTAESTVVFNAATNVISNTGDRAAMRGFIYKFNPTTNTFTKLLEFPLDYAREQAIDFCSNNAQAEFYPWAPIFDSDVMLAAVSGTTGESGTPGTANFLPGERAYPQAWITDIEFDEEGKMIIGIRDRFADQHGYSNPPPSNLEPNVEFTADGAGDILMASINTTDNTTYVLESNSANGTNGAAFGPTRGLGQGEGPDGGEFFFDDRYRPANGIRDGNPLDCAAASADPTDQDPNLDPQFEVGHDEIATGGLFHYNGAGEVYSSVYDPINDYDFFNNAGINSFSVADGSRLSGNQIYATTPIDNATFAKGNGLGDIEGLAPTAPLQIGNRLWVDANNNGRQDPDESGLNGVLVELFKETTPGNFTKVAETTTAADPVQGDGFFIFSDDTAGDQTWVGGFAEVEEEMNYEVRVSLANVQAVDNTIQAFTTSDANGDSTNDSKTDLNDSDASPAGVISVTTGRAGQNNHTLDIGVTQSAVCSITVDLAEPSACDPLTNEYTLSVTVSYADAPAGEMLTINTSSGDSQDFSLAGATGTETFILTGLDSDGATGVNVTATFATTTTCTDDLDNAYDAPDECVCDISIDGVTASVCDPATNTYTLSVAVTYENAPAGEDIRIITSNGVNELVSPASSDGTETFMITGLTSDGVPDIDVMVEFETTTTCTDDLTDAYSAPVDCTPAPCSITPTVSSVCNDNGTPSDPSDDYVVFTLDFTGSVNTGTSFTLTEAGGVAISQVTGDLTYANAGTSSFRLPNGSADGMSDFSITVTDSDDGGCSEVVTIEDVASCSETCDLTITAAPNPCDVTDNAYELTITVTYANPPAGDISITVAGGTPMTFTPSGTSPDMFTISGLTSDGATGVMVSAEFVADMDCDATAMYDAPVRCLVTVDPPMPCVGNAGDIGGTAFLDLDNDGTNDAEDNGQEGIVVMVFDCEGNLVRNTTTGSNGEWTVTGLADGPDDIYRVEFSIPPALYYLQPGYAGANNATDVQFVQTVTCEVDFGVFNASDFCEDNPSVFLPCYENGLRAGNTGIGLLEFKYDDSQTTGTKNNIAEIQEIGSTWGTTYQRGTQRIFTAAFAKRHVDFGAQGPGGMYVIDYGDPAYPITEFTLQGVTPAVGPVLDFGDINRSTSMFGLPADDFQLSPSRFDPNRDLDAYLKVGTVGYGDIDLDLSENTLWAVNVNQRSLVSMDVSGSTLPGTVNHYILEDLPGFPDCATSTNTATTTIRINAGGSGFTDSNGNTWVADQFAVGVSDPFATTAPVANLDNPLEGTLADESFYQNLRAGANFSYRIPVTNGRYKVILHHKSGSDDEPDERVFNISSEGQAVASSFDMARSRAGLANRATTVQFAVEVTDAELDINLANVNPGGGPTLSGIEVIPIEEGVSGEARPWGLGFHEGKGYLGVVCDASISLDREHLDAVVLSFDPNNVAAGFTTVASLDLDYNRENVGGTLPGAFIPAAWACWRDFSTLRAEVGDPSIGGTAQPILSDIEFTENGSMVLGFMDRAANQWGVANHSPFSGNTNTSGSGVRAGGDIIHLCKIGDTFVLEGEAGCSTNDPGGFAQRTDDGPSNTGEFYYADFFVRTSPPVGRHLEIATGGLAQLKGSGEILTTVYDPTQQAANSGVFSQGVHWYNNTTGAFSDAYVIVETTGSIFVLTPDGFGKAQGLGDPNLLCDPAPIQIGNYVWIDTDEDGVQDPCEIGIDGVPVSLYNKETNAFEAVTVTANGGEYYFNDVDTGTEYAIVFGYDYTNPGGTTNTWDATAGSLTVGGTAYQLTTADADGGNPLGPDANNLNDSDATLMDMAGLTQYPIISYTTGTETDHTLDVGLTEPTAAFDLALTKTLATGQGSSVAVGDEVVFTIMIYNQGTIAATNIDVTDYLPSNTTYSATSSTATGSLTSTLSNAVALTNNGDGTFTLDALAGGDEVSFDIALTVGASALGTLTNNAEIVDADGGVDEDSPLTSVIGSSDDLTEVPTNGDINDDGPGTPGTTDNTSDEDDYDPEQFMVVQCDLMVAVTPVCNDNGTPAVPSDDYVVFTLDFTGSANTGTSFTLTETGGATITQVSGDLTYANAGSSSFRLPDGSADGMSDFSITVTDDMDATCTETFPIEDVATCSGACDLMVAVTPVCNDNGTPSDPSDDYVVFTLDFTGSVNLGTSFTLTETGGATITQVSGDLTYANAGSSSFRLPDGSADGMADFSITVTDDVTSSCTDVIVIQDVANCSNVFDLALRKTLAPASAATFAPGDPVAFAITVFNQGTAAAFDIDVADYAVDTELDFVDFTPLPTTTENGAAVTVIPGATTPTFEINQLSAGDSVTIIINFTVDAAFVGTSIINNAEIVDASDIDGGMTAPDEDSPLTDINDGMMNELATNDDIDDDTPNSPGAEDNDLDEDDYDAEEITVTIDPTVSIADPCVCFDVEYDLPEVDPFEFTDSIEVRSATGQVWRVYDLIGVESVDSFVNRPFPLDTTLTEVLPGTYSMKFAHTANVGYTIFVTNTPAGSAPGTLGDSLSIGATCFQPEPFTPSLQPLMAPLCPTEQIALEGAANFDGMLLPGGSFTYDLILGNNPGDTLFNQTEIAANQFASGTTIIVTGRYTPPAPTDPSINAGMGFCGHTFSQEVTFDDAVCATCDLTITGITPTCAYNSADGQSTFTVQVDLSWDSDFLPTTPDVIEVTLDGMTMSTGALNTVTGTTSVTFTNLSGPAYGMPITAVFTNEPTCDANSFVDLIACTDPCVADGIGGNVFNDFNNDGADAGASEVGQENVLVEVYDCDGMLVCSTWTNTNGDWTCPDLNDMEEYRVEFSTPLQPYLQPSFAGTDNGTDVQFVVAPTCEVDFGVKELEQVCSDDPTLATACYVFGPINGPNAAEPALVGFQYSANLDDADGNSAGTQPGRIIATVAQAGTLYGVAYDLLGNLYAGAFTRRHSDIGPGGTGMIYRITPDGTLSEFVDLGVTAGGANPHASTTDWQLDAGAIDAVYKTGLGDMDFDAATNSLYTVGLANKSLYRINLDDGSVDGPFPIPAQGCGVTDWQPFAVDVNAGIVYVGGTCTGQSTGDIADVGVSVLQFDPISLSFTEVFAMDDFSPTGFPRAAGFLNWRAWADNPFAVLPAPNSAAAIYPQPLLADIEFVGTDLVLGIRDRMGDQSGVDAPGPNGENGGNLYDGRAAGDIVRAGGSPATGWTLEQNGMVSGLTSGISNATGGQFGGQTGADFDIGPGGNDNSEFYDDSHDFDYDNGLGGLLQLDNRPGEIMTSQFDPTPTNQGATFDVFFNSGVRVLSNQNGSYLRSYDVVQSSSVQPTPAFGKAAGIGDVAAFCGPGPIQIGNYVWIDTDEDGVQDPCELPVEGVQVSLYNKDTDMFEQATTTNADGEYYFNDVNPNTEYAIVFGYDFNNLTADGSWDNTDELLFVEGIPYELTVADAGNAPLPLGPDANDLNDSDATLMDMAGVTQYPIISYSTADTTDHTLDVGLRPAALTSIGSTVFVDNNNNAMQDTDDMGIEGVELLIYQVVGDQDGNGNTEMDDVLLDVGSDGDLSTSSDGMNLATNVQGDYLFQNLPPGDYYIVIEGGQFGIGEALEDTQISSTDIGSTVGDNQTDSDDNGQQPAGRGTAVFSPVITLDVDAEPTDTGTDPEDGQGGMQDNGPDPLVDANGDMTVDFGFFAPVAVGDTAFVDLDDDGLQTPGEPGIGGVTVTLLDENGDQVLEDAEGNPITGETTTAADGSYRFDNLPPGVYSVTFDISTADDAEFYDFTTPNAGDDTDDSDNSNPVNATTTQSDPTSFLTSGQEDITLDVGVVCITEVTVADPFAVCSTQPIDLTSGASVSPASLGGSWTSSGDGTFFDASNEPFGAGETVTFGTAVRYIPGPQDIRNGEVTLTLTTNEPAGPCEAVSASVTVQILKVDCGQPMWDGN